MAAGLIRHRIFDELREDILSCDLRPGAEVSEIALARKYGVSKTPIRDALQKLEFEGLVEIAPRQGHRVIPISITDARDILELREILETAAVRKIARDASDADLADLGRFRVGDQSDPKAFARYNRKFHAELARMAGNARQTDLMRNLMDNYERLCIVSLSARKQEAKAMAAAHAEHIAIIDALQARDGRTAARLSAKHIRKSHVQIMRGLENPEVVE